MMDLSVVTVTKNALGPLRETVASVASQLPRSHHEHVVVDGASTDGTPDWLATQPVRWVSEPDNGIADALNKGFRMAKGKFVLVLGAGDTLVSERSVASAVAHIPGAGPEILCFDVQLGDRRLAWSDPKRRLEWKAIAHQGVLLPRDLFHRLGGFDTSLRIAMDYDLLLRAKRAGARFRRVPILLSHMATGGLSARDDWPSLAERFQEERRVQLQSARGTLHRGAYRAFWPPYLAYRGLRSLLRQRRSPPG